MSDTPTSAAPLDDLFAAGPQTQASRSVKWSAETRPLSGVHGWLRGCLYLYIVMQVASLVILVTTVWTLAALADGSVVGDPRMAVIGVVLLTWAQLAPYVLIGTFVVCVLCYSLFVYRAMKNLHLSNARGLTISPGWAVGWSFVPFANLAMIYNVMKEIWRSSRDPDMARQSPPSTLALWWGLWITGNIVGRISAMMEPKGDAAGDDPAGFYEAFIPSTVVAVGSVTLAIISTICLLTIVRQITSDQGALRARTS